MIPQSYDQSRLAKVVPHTAGCPLCLTLRFSARTAFIVGKDGRIRDVVTSEIPIARDIPKLIEKTREA